MADRIRESFFGLPVPGYELGVSEKVGDFISKNIYGVNPTRTADGGSQLTITGQRDVNNSISPIVTNTNASLANATKNNGQPINYTQTSGQQTTDQNNGGGGGNGGGGLSYDALKKAMQNGDVIWDDNKLAEAFNAEKSSAGISDLYAPALELADKQETFLRSGAVESTDQLLNRVGQSEDKLGLQKDELLTATDEEQRQFNDTIREALSQAVRSFQGLRQQSISRFGGGNSAGRAIGELVSQEFLRQQGDIGRKQVEGTQDFGQERTRIQNFIADSTNQLENYKNETLSEIQRNLEGGLLEIDARRGDIEANKTRDKMNLLQQARDRVAAIQDADKQFRQQLFLEAVNNMQQVEGRQFSPDEIIATLSDFESQFTGIEGNGPVQGSTGANNTALLAARAALGQNNEDDEITQLASNPTNLAATNPSLANAAQYIS